MVSVEKWKDHFKRLAHKSFPHEDMYIVSQSGRGLGRNAYKKTLYQIRAPKFSNTKPTIEIVSPVASTLQRAKALTKASKGIKSKGKKKSSSSSKGSGGKKKSPKSKAPKKKTGPKKKKAAVATKGTKKNKAPKKKKAKGKGKKKK